MKLLVLAIASVTMLLALLPAPVLASGREIELSATTRTYVFAVCAAVCVGVLIAGVRA
ncbi:MAG TPA: hypothetical protein VNH40_05420 [Gaiellaceae bacterium]|nr:hypothetical protein [Gaiellaceae bacterium]